MFSAGLAAAAGSIGVIIPPSIPFVIYAVATGTSISDLFIAGVIPGILVGVALMIVSYILSKKNGWKGSEQKPSIKNVMVQFKESFWALLMPVIVLGSIYASICTPTEAAVIGIVYAVAVGKLVYKELEWKYIYKAVVDAALINGATSFMIGLSSSFASYLTMARVPSTVALLLTSATDSSIAILFIINIFLLIVGCFIDNISSCLILAPIFLPIVVSYGISPVHFGLVMTLALAIGFVTPPYGANLFVATAISGVPFNKVARSAVPLVLAMIAVLLAITYIEPLSMTLVRMVAK